jgi:hypothetical protein
LLRQARVTERIEATARFLEEAVQRTGDRRRQEHGEMLLREPQQQRFVLGHGVERECLGATDAAVARWLGVVAHDAEVLAQERELAADRPGLARHVGFRKLLAQLRHSDLARARDAAEWGDGVRSSIVALGATGSGLALLHCAIDCFRSDNTFNLCPEPFGQPS